MKRIPKTKVEVMEERGKVALLRLTNKLGTVMYGVRYPHKVGNEESSLQITSQFMREDEARREYSRFAEFFGSRP